jgi:hypothetical protein
MRGLEDPHVEMVATRYVVRRVDVWKKLGRLINIRDRHGFIA